jgi:hypothetical protein
MARGVRMFTGMAVRRAVAAQGDPTLLTRAQVHPVIADFHTFSAFANFRLFHGCDRAEMRAGSVRHYKISSSVCSSRERCDYPSGDKHCNSERLYFNIPLSRAGRASSIDQSVTFEKLESKMMTKLLAATS